MNNPPIFEKTITLKDYTFIKELGLGSIGIARCYRSNKSDKDLFVFKQFFHTSSSDFIMDCLKFHINFLPILSYTTISKLASNENDSIFLILTKYFESGSLENQIINKSLTPTEKSITIFGIAAAIFFLHSKDLFHGHLYPSNILFTEQKEPRICDYSLFLLHPHDNLKIKEINKSPFLSTEQLLESKVNAKTDVFSFGKILLYILTDNSSIKQTSLNDFYTKLISKCCDENPDNRPYFSDILQLFMSNTDFILNGSDFQKISEYQYKLFPNGLHINNQHIPKPIENRRLFLLPPILNDEIKQNFDKETTQNSTSKATTLSNPSISIFSIGSNFNRDRLSYESNQYNITVPVYNDHHSLKQGPIVNEERRRKSSEAETPNSIYEYRHNNSDSYPYKTTHKNEIQIVIENDEIESQIDANLKISADCGNIESQFKYGSILLNGPLDTAQEGARYIKFAADGGHLGAQKLYAHLARSGTIIHQNMKLCDHYMKLAADSGDLTSQIEYASMLDQAATDILCQSSSSSTSSSSSSGSTSSSVSSSNSVVSSNSSVAQILKNAAKYYYLAAQQNDRNAQFIYGTFLEEGKGVQIDLDEAIRYFRLSAEQGYTIAQLKLAFLLKNEESVKYLKLAADSDNTYAMVMYSKLLILICLDKHSKLFDKELDQALNFSIKKSVSEAMKYLLQAVKLESHRAMYFLGCLMYYFSDALKMKRFCYMGHELEHSENLVFNHYEDCIDEEEEEEEKEESTTKTPENELQNNIKKTEEEEKLEEEMEEDKKQNESRKSFVLSDEDDNEYNQKYYKILKTVFRIVNKHYISKEESCESSPSGGKFRQFVTRMLSKNLSKKDKLIKALKLNGLKLIQKASSLGDSRAQFQCAMINLGFSRNVGKMDLKFFNNLINPTESTTSNNNNNTSSNNNKKKFSFDSSSSFFFSKKDAYFDDYWDENLPKIENNSEKVSESLELIVKASNNGLSDAQYLVGLLLLNNNSSGYVTSKLNRHTVNVPSNLTASGVVVIGSDTLANDCIKMAADSGSVRAQLAYALIIDDGHGIPKNLREASRYYKMAADNGSYAAMINIGFMLFDGRGINRNRKEALSYMKLAADANYLVASFKYGTMLYNGQGTNKDVKESVKYFEKVIKNEARLTSPGIRHASEISSLQMIQESARCIRNAAEQGVSTAMRVYAIMLLKEICFQSNVPESLRWFKKAAKQNDPIALNFVANRIFKTGEGDRLMAVKMLKTAADEGYNIAQFNYAMIVEEGDESIELKQDLVEAASYYKMAADQNYAPAQLHYAMMLEVGEGCQKNVELAAVYYKKAARSQSEAMIHYGKMLRKGIYVKKKNVKLALKYFRTAAKMGNKEGQYYFARMLQKGEGVKCNKSLALSLFKEAASQPMISRSLCTSKAQFRYAEYLIEKNEINNILRYGEATKYYLAASDYEEPPEMNDYKLFEKRIRNIRFTLLFMLLLLYILQKLFV